jgi:hypothetical protein
MNICPEIFELLDATDGLTHTAKLIEPKKREVIYVQNCLLGCTAV